MRPIVIAAATEDEFVIGANNSLPWPRIKGDFEFMKHVTKKERSALVMGRKTFESIGRLLPDRVSIIVTKEPREPLFAGSSAGYFLGSLEDAFCYCRTHALRPIIFGGESIYKEAMSVCKEFTLYLTIIHGKFEGDRHFPLSVVDRTKLANITEKVAKGLSLEKISGVECASGKMHEKGIAYSFYQLHHGYKE